MIDYKWGKVSCESDLKNQMEERFKDDLGTLLSEGTKDATVIFQIYLPAIRLQGIIIDKKQTKIFDFICKISNNHTISYTDAKTNKTIDKSKTYQG